MIHLLFLALILNFYKQRCKILNLEIMKAKQYTTAMLIALVFTTTAIQAQSARRPANQHKQERARTTSTHQKVTKSQTVKKSQPARSAVHVKSGQPERSNQTARVSSQQNRNKVRVKTNQTAHVRTQHAKGTANARTAQKQQVRKPVSMTTTRNPGNNYRKLNNRIPAKERYSAPVKSKIYKNRVYYGGNHYHYAYPTRKVNIHYHHDTYVNHYHVLYYPSYGNIYWTRNMYHDYNRWYPGFRWNYNYGYRIQSISVFDAKYNMGEVAMVYGRVYATWYNKETDDYLLFFGGDYPYQQFSVVIPGHVAHKFSWRPERYFLGEHITVTGLITTFDGSPEIVVKNKRQLDLY